MKPPTITVRVKLSEKLKDLRATEHYLQQKQMNTDFKLKTVRGDIDVYAGQLAACENE